MGDALGKKDTKAIGKLKSRLLNAVLTVLHL